MTLSARPDRAGFRGLGAAGKGKHWGLGSSSHQLPPPAAKIQIPQGLYKEIGRSNTVAFSKHRNQLLNPLQNKSIFETMARTHRSSSSSASDADSIPRYFAKNGHPDQNPRAVKKNGSGRYNWGNPQDDIDDLDATSEFNFSHSRRRSNSSSMHAGVPRMQVSAVDVDEVFDEEDE